jgi:hypothetical protein
VPLNRIQGIEHHSLLLEPPPLEPPAPPVPFDELSAFFSVLASSLTFGLAPEPELE